jgi:hypothetical protein
MYLIFFLKTSNINVPSIRKTNNFENNALKAERVQKTFEILILLR